MKRVVLSLTLLALLLLSAAPAMAETGGLRIANMTVSVWPEYDEPRVLVLYEGKLGPDASFPQEVRFRVPKGAEITQTCAIKKPGDEHLCQLNETTTEGDWTIVSYKVPLPDFLVEYYYNPVSGAGARTLDFSFLPTYPVDSLQLEVQQPLRSSDFTLSPSTEIARSDQQGLKYYHYDFKDVTADKTVAVKVSYSKSDARPSVNKPPQQGAAGGSGDADSSRLLWVIVAVAMVGAIAVVLVRQRRRGVEAPAPQMAWQGAGAGRVAAGRAPASGAGRGIYCTQCGRRLHAADRFCPECGAKQRGTR